MRRPLTLLLALALAMGLAACGGEPTSCPPGQVLERDNDGAECEPDANANGIDDEDEGLEEEDDDGSVRRKRRRR